MLEFNLLSNLLRKW